MEYPTSRAEAQASGAAYYFTGKPCVRGHVAPRKTKGVCLECMREDWKIENARRSLKPESAAAKAAKRRYYVRNKEVVKARAKARPVEDARKYKNTWKARNPEAVQVSSNAWKRRAREAAPVWLTAEQKAEISAVYAKARAMTKMAGTKYVVDHIVPLRSPIVCGLHVPWNLQILTHEENCSKGNSLLE